MSLAAKIPTLELDHFKLEFQNDYRLLNHEVDGRNLIAKPHKHDFFLFFLVEKGGGTHLIEHSPYAVKDQQLHILLPDQQHQWELNEGTTGYQFMINKQVFQTIANSSYFNFIKSQVLNLTPETFNALWQEFRTLENELLAKQGIDWRIIYTRSQLITLLIDRELQSRYQTELSSHVPALLLEFHNLINSVFRQQKQVSYYASELNITANYLNILSKRHFGRTALSMIQSRVTQEAMSLLRYSPHSIKEIAYSLGFKDVSYFTNFFKLQTGSSPRAFKSTMQKAPANESDS